MTPAASFTLEEQEFLKGITPLQLATLAAPFCIPLGATSPAIEAAARIFLDSCRLVEAAHAGAQPETEQP